MNIGDKITFQLNRSWYGVPIMEGSQEYVKASGLLILRLKTV